MRILHIIILFILITFFPSITYAIKSYKKNHKLTKKVIVVCAFSLICFISFFIIQYASRNDIINLKILEWSVFSMMIVFIPISIYTLFDLIYTITYKRFNKNYKWIKLIGIIIFSIIILGLLLGAYQRNNIRIKNITLRSNKIPKEFNDVKIVHITDLHLGNITPEKAYLNKIINTIKNIQPDLLIFTGDLVTLNADEADNINNIFTEINAPLGRYAIMGNHDYGDYFKWNSYDQKANNLNKTFETYKRLGFNLLNDTAIYIKRKNDSIGLIGVEYWGLDPFPKYGNLKDATKVFKPADFNILLTHDPNHWKEEVINDYKFIDLTLSGHTHGGQLGLKIGKRLVSPSQIIYKYWNGLYKEGNQWLYISSGLGYVGIPFRLGMPPDISIITLKSE